MHITYIYSNNTQALINDRKNELREYEIQLRQLLIDDGWSGHELRRRFVEDKRRNDIQKQIQKIYETCIPEAIELVK